MTPWHLKVVGWLSLLWNLVGGAIYVASRLEIATYTAALSSAQAAWFETMPIWVAVAYALGVWGAVVGSILLIARSRLAVLAFVLSLIGVLVTTGYSLSLPTGDAAAITSPTPLAFSSLLIVISAALWLYARAMAARGHLR
ncbi:hypothetical protein [uncultured Maritimibacter sp.]|uniref:hypothetical protein n=1 Tax=uncultured Maritimibacter sp. TaxID=991866 RepID=UPI002635F6AD|nr:hypothetical protein [uncultured Maritimibacter sp.]